MVMVMSSLDDALSGLGVVGIDHVFADKLKGIGKLGAEVFFEVLYIGLDALLGNLDEFPLERFMWLIFSRHRVIGFDSP